MIRVGFVFAFNSNAWLGGINYFRNLLTAIDELAERRIEPVIITSTDVAPGLTEGFPPFETLQTILVEAGSLPWKARRFLQIYAKRDVFFEAFLKKHQIVALSHSGHLGRFCPIPTLPWIPDFQELHLPEYFSNAERTSRARIANEACRHATAVLFSSQTAAADFARSAANCRAGAEVLPFVAAVPSLSAFVPRDEIEARYNFSGPYYFLPNQFWVHKNHTVVLKALALLKERGLCPLVLATGNANDHRQPGHYQALMAQVASLGISDRFRSLGVVPYKDIMSLMRWSVATINPSLFEGWSTTVEEAKSMGKTLILSDIPTHREQAPARGHYFEPRDFEGLAMLMTLQSNRYDPVEDDAAVKAATLQIEGRRRDFARHYEDIILRLVGANVANVSDLCRPNDRQ
jgi:hypothetical protein